MKMENEKKNRTILRHPKITDDWLRVTGQTNAHDLARHLSKARPDTFAWEEGSGTLRYARSLHAQGGISLSYARRNQEALDAPQSDSRDSKDFMLEVPGHHADELLPVLRDHADARTFQAPRRDLAITARFDLDVCAQVYTWWTELLDKELRRPAWRLGPDGSPWNSVTLQTHQKPSKAPRFALLYDKHAESPDEFTEPGTLRFEFRFQAEKAAQKKAVFNADAELLLRSWRLSRKALELLSNNPQAKSFTWTEPAQDSDLETMTLRLLASYGPTLVRGMKNDPAGYLRTLALGALLQATAAPINDHAHPVSLSAPQAA
jgi:hypothetical protein